MRVLDLFSGLKGWSAPFKERGHEVFCVELDQRFPADHRDVMDFDVLSHNPFDVILASPPCTSFSVMRIGVNWTEDHQPKTDAARHGVILVNRTLEIIKQAAPKYFIIENPRAKLRKLPMMQKLERRTVTYCQYGEIRMKPTDLWGKFPQVLFLKPPCENGAPCHVRAPRGSTTGTQGMDSAESAKIPLALATVVLDAIELEEGMMSGLLG